VRKRRRTERGGSPPPDSNPFSEAEFAKNLVCLSRQISAFRGAAVIRRIKTSHRPFVRKRGQGRTKGRRAEGAIAQNCPRMRFEGLRRVTKKKAREKWPCRGRSDERKRCGSSVDWGRGAPLARFDDASKLPQWPSDRPHTVKQHMTQ